MPIMTNGRRIRQHAPTLDGARDWARQQIDALPPELRSLEDTGYSYPVAVSDRIVGELARLRHADTAEAHPGPTSSGRRPNDPRTTSSSSLDFGLPTHRKLAVTPSSGGTP